MQHRRILRFAVLAYMLTMLTPGGLGAQTPVPVSEAPLVTAPPPAVAVVPPPTASFLAGIQQRRQQRFQQRQERRHHTVEKVKSLFGMGS